ncbi:metalloprotease, partial [Sinorhizobium meliloti]
MASDGTTIASGEWHPPGSSRSVPASLVERAGRLVVDGESGGELAGGSLHSIE